MKPDWDKLMKNWNSGERSRTTLVADVDCIAGGKSLCREFGIAGFPTIKWGDPSSLEDYNGERDYESLLEFAEENLKPLCTPANLDLCDDEKKKAILDLQAIPIEELEQTVMKKKKIVRDAEIFFDNEVEKLQATYEKGEKRKDGIINEVKNSDFGLMKAVLAAAQKTAPDEEL